MEKYNFQFKCFFLSLVVLGRTYRIGIGDQRNVYLQTINKQIKKKNEI